MPSLSLSASDMVREQGKRAGPLVLIVLLHFGFFIALQSGLSHQATQAQAEPREIVASFIAAAPASEHEGKPLPAPQPTPSEKKQTKHAAKPRHSASRPVARTTPADRPSPLETPKAPASAATELAAPAPAAPQSAEPAASSAPAPASQAAAPTVSNTAPRTISGVEYIQPPQPEYPPLSRRMREEGKVLLRILVDEKGHPERVEIHTPSGFARLDEAARQAAKRALFKPHLENGRPVPVFALVPVNFSLQ